MTAKKSPTKTLSPEQSATIEGAVATVKANVAKAPKHSAEKIAAAHMDRHILQRAGLRNGMAPEAVHDAIVKVLDADHHNGT